MNKTPEEKPIEELVKPVTIYKQTFRVTDRDIDFRKELSLSALSCYLQDIAGTHAENLGAGSTLLNEKGMAWILMRLRIDIVRMPTMYETFTLETWPQQPSVQHERDFLLRDTYGKVLARAASIWIIMDYEKREIVKDAQLSYAKMEPIEERAIKEGAGKVKPSGNPVYAGERKISYSYIDFNMHLNNTRYMDLIMDSLGIDFIEQHKIDQIEINFVNEVRGGDILIMGIDRSAEEKGILYVQGGARNTQKISFRAKLLFSERNK
ncbi:MAG: acyl-ACP thioesterase [Clostridiales Family XIII bacterium]|jgi:acyl-ACP thioesterase|nr:acyl-ACP thioesterase [Clostridiales Family XIII bacterium]